MGKFQSITTQEVEHDVVNLLTEILLLNKYGSLESYCWRKGHSMAKEWPKSLALIRRLIKSNGIKPEQLAWYFYKFQPKEISPKEFGLVAWKVKRLFPKMPIAKIHRIYIEKHKPEDQGYFALKEQGEPVKAEAPSAKPNLLSLLDQLENKSGTQKEE